MQEVKYCEHCGKAFYPTGPRQKYCSAACRNQHNSNKSYRKRPGRTAGEVLCAYCGKLFRQSRSNQLYCSASCQNRAKRRQVRERVSRVCPVCGRLFSSSRIGKYCSAACRRKARETFQFERQCVICGKTFGTNWKEAQTCSAECRNRLLIAQRINRKEGANREFYPGTVALIHKWYAGGDTVEEIMEQTERSRERVLEALATPLTPLEQSGIEKGVPYRNRKRGPL